MEIEEVVLPELATDEEVVKPKQPPMWVDKFYLGSEEQTEKVMKWFNHKPYKNDF